MQNSDLPKHRIFEKQLKFLLDKEPLEVREKLPSTPIYFGQMRVNQPNKAMFLCQFGKGMEFQIKLTKKFVGMFEDATVASGKIKSWHSDKLYTPMMFWPEFGQAKTVVALYINEKLRAYQAYVNVVFNRESFKLVGHNGIHPDKRETI